MKKSREEILATRGFLEIIKINKPIPKIQVSYGGNMGATEERSIKPEFEKLYGEGTFHTLMTNSSFQKNTYSSSGISHDPSYLWVRELDFSVWEKLFTKH